MMPTCMTAQEMRELSEHIINVAMHAGQVLGDSRRGAPKASHAHLESVLTAARAFYLAAKRFDSAMGQLHDGPHHVPSDP